MAGGVSKHYEQAWVYHAGGTRFEDRVGAILSRGTNLQETFRQEALQQAKKAIAFENMQRQEKGYNPAQAGSDFYKQTDAAKPTVDARGMVWVTGQGETIGPATTESFSDLPPAPSPVDALTTEKQKFVAALDTTQRSMHLWRKVNPGCMEVTTKLPVTTHKDHFQYNREKMEPLNKERFRLKSDFTEYCNATIRGGGGFR